MLQQRLANALGQTAVHLAVHDHGVHNIAKIVASGHAVNARVAGFWVNFDFTDVGARRESEVARVVKSVLVQARLKLVVREVVRHISGERNRSKWHGFVGARDFEITAFEHDVALGGFHQVRGDLLALGNHFVHGFDDGRATHGERAAAISAHAKQHLAGVAVLDADVVHGDAQPVGHDLRKGCFVALAMAVAAGEDGDLAGGVHPHFTGFKQACACAQRPGHAGRRNAAGFDVGRIAQAALQTLGRAGGFAGGKTGHVGQFNGACHGGVVVTHVIR